MSGHDVIDESLMHVEHKERHGTETAGSLVVCALDDPTADESENGINEAGTLWSISPHQKCARVAHAQRTPQRSGTA